MDNSTKSLWHPQALSLFATFIMGLACLLLTIISSDLKKAPQGQSIWRGTEDELDAKIRAEVSRQMGIEKR